SALLAKRVDGIIVTGRRTDPRPPLDLGGAGVPIIYAFAQVADPRALCLLPDDLGGARLAAEHLIGLGRTRIAHVTGPRDFEAVRRRRGDDHRTLEAHRLPWRYGVVVRRALGDARGGEGAAGRPGGRQPRDAGVCRHD